MGSDLDERLAVVEPFSEYLSGRQLRGTRKSLRSRSGERVQSAHKHWLEPAVHKGFSSLGNPQIVHHDTPPDLPMSTKTSHIILFWSDRVTGTTIRKADGFTLWYLLIYEVELNAVGGCNSCPLVQAIQKSKARRSSLTPFNQAGTMENETGDA